VPREGFSHPANVPEVAVECSGVDRDDRAVGLLIRYVTDGVVCTDAGVHHACRTDRLLQARNEQRPVRNAGDAKVIHDKSPNFEKMFGFFPME
jgi:hypothetical protein